MMYCYSLIRTCPKCEFQALLPPTEMIFRCPLRECLFESCRKCREQSHIPLRCEEVEKLSETAGRLKVEEAISAAKIRTCPRPNCGKKFVKEDGCNKMTCPCGVWVCYVCRQEIAQDVGYSHFCRMPHCSHKSCNSCALNTDTKEEDEQAMRDAGRKAAVDFHEATLVQPHTHLELPVHIDVSKIMQQPSPHLPLFHARVLKARLNRVVFRRERDVHTQIQALQTYRVHATDAQARKAARIQVREAAHVHRAQVRYQASLAHAYESARTREAALKGAKVASAIANQAREATQLREDSVYTTSAIAAQAREAA